MFHDFMLKKKVEDGAVADTSLPITTADGLFKVEPVAVLAKRVIRHANQAMVQGLIQWSN